MSYFIVSYDGSNGNLVRADSEDEARESFQMDAEHHGHDINPEYIEVEKV